MKNVFIDSQVWLSLYDFSSDDLDQFSKLNELIDKDVKIYLTEQVVEEVKRNRDSKIKESLSLFNKINIQIPNLCKGYEEYKTFMSLAKKLHSSHKDLLNKVESDIEVEKLHADNVINDIFGKLIIIDRTPEIVNKSILRYNIGNPPGKDKSYGDAINWITLLDVVPDGEDMFLISSDKDFRSVLYDNRLNKFLAKEWKERKSSEIFLYRSLTEFFNLHLKDIELKTENLKNALIEQLRQSFNYANTHTVIKKLSEYTSWTTDQAIELLRVADSNSQVRDIINDPDVDGFFSSVLQDKLDHVFAIEDLHWILKKIGYDSPQLLDEGDMPF